MKPGELERLEKYANGMLSNWDATLPKAILVELLKAAREAERYKAVIEWALGERGDFRPKTSVDSSYWWRKELRERAFQVEPPHTDLEKETKNEL